LIANQRLDVSLRRLFNSLKVKLLSTTKNSDLNFQFPPVWSAIKTNCQEEKRGVAEHTW
jgi:hypothetical protein